MSTPDPTSAHADGNVPGCPAMPPAADPRPEEPEYVLWPHTGQESVFLYPPGSVEEHLHPGAVGDLLAVGHAHQEAA